MDATEDSARLLEHSLMVFDKKENHFCGVFVDGLSEKNMILIFDNPVSINNEYSHSEILQKILHSEENNSEEFITKFTDKCAELNLKTQVYLDRNSIDHGLVNDSLYSDLLVIGKSILTHKNKDKIYSEAIEMLLRNSKCPVLLMPNEINPVENIILLFNGTEKSFEAIKLFLYLFDPQLAKNKVILFTIMTEKAMEEEKHIHDYLKTNKQFFSIFRGHPESYFNDLKELLIQFDNFILVTGVNRNEIIEDLIFNNDHSFFLEGNRSVFMI